ncbi:hypothetical protein [Tessaracoccus defluvii]|uniref:WXG100 family type VII secretion target n=1 Tax=Tessaracoccus defluvii TaxID=1285901 RepID=A0A7H0H9N9_9ACTN|nr:hypothetical protein [Tessaracoccus defluvii]QNP57255.1 hypothetical protein H9L22_08460 [Tessaracoccus defluvii]
MNQYNNALDTWYNDCPGPVQQVLSYPYGQVSEALRFVTGDPNKVAGYGPTYLAVSREIERISGEVESLNSGIVGWEGEARTAFGGAAQTLSDSLHSLAPAVAQTQEILNAAAETSVEAANMILDIIRSLIEFLLTSLAIAAALAAFTFGASAAAWVAANLAKGAHALAKIMQGLTRVAQVLTRIAQALEKIARVLQQIKRILEQLKLLLDVVKAAKKAAPLAGKAMALAITAAARTPIKLAANGVLAGVSGVTGVPGLSMPGGMGELWKAGNDGLDAVEASNRAVDAANR